MHMDYRLVVTSGEGGMGGRGGMGRGGMGKRNGRGGGGGRGEVNTDIRRIKLFMPYMPWP